MFPHFVLLLKIDARLIVFGVVVFIVFLFVVGHAWDRRRRRDIAQLLEGRGFTVQAKPVAPERESLFALFAALPELRHSGAGLRWAASGPLAGSRVHIIEHAYTVKRGKNSHTVVNLCLAVAGGASWPLLTLSNESVLDRLGEKLSGKPDLKLEDDRFNKRWRIRCEDDGFALAILTPEVQAAIGQGESGEWWSFGGPGGLVCLGRRGTFTAQKLDPLFARLESVLAAIPPEARAGLGL
jgi:hypothetical protein